MTQTTQETETLEQAEYRLWTEYMATLTHYHDVWQMKDGAWRIYVTTKSDTDGREWERLVDLGASLRERVSTARRVWEKAAYPLYDWPLNDEDED